MPEAFLHGIEVLQIDDGIRPIQTVRSSVIGLVGTAPLADATKFPLNEPVLLLGTQRAAADLGATGTLKDAVDGIFDQIGAAVVVVRVEEGADEAETLTNVVGDGPTFTGVHALLSAEAKVGVAPKVLIAPGWTSQRPAAAANPVVAELLGIAQRMRAVIVADGPSTTQADALVYAGDWGSDRVYIADPGALVWDTDSNQNVAQPASARVAGAIARRDKEKGFWHSPSNQVLNGITGTERPIDFNLSDSNCVANLLNENKVATIVRKDGFRLWGNRTTATDPLWAFLPVRRTADMIYESIEQALLWAMDRPISTQLLRDVEGSVNAYLRDLVAKGALLGGRAWLDAELNSPTNLQAGKVYVDFDIEPPAPMERLTFRAHRNLDYYEELILQVAA